MAIDTNIVNFGQSTPTADALSGLGQGIAGAITANKQAGIADNRKQAAVLLRQAFSDESDPAQTEALLAQAEQLDPEFTLGMVQKVRQGAGADKFSATTISLPGGITIQTTSSGKKVVTDAGGRILTGEEAVDAIELAEETKAQRIVDLTKAKTRAKEEGKGEGFSSAAPSVAEAKAKIASAIITAKAEAKDKGETLSDLENAKAAMPGLQNVVGQLRELSNIATSTIAGNVFDFAVRESGFGSTEGATAKAKFVAIINNQVLPLLKQTFGGAFSVAEGESLKATMGDPDASVEEKLAQLDAFIDSKVREAKLEKLKLKNVD